MQGHVTIDSEFFAKVKHDYSNWREAFWREIFQNSIDAPNCDKITVEINDGSGQTIITVENNGDPMSRDVLLNKFLTLGGTTKNFSGSIGGFGVAKSLICLCHKSYTIRTGDMQVIGTGGSYELMEGLDQFDGTKTEVIMKGTERSRFEQELRAFCSYAQWAGTVILKVNGKEEELALNLKKGSPRKNLFSGDYENAETVFGTVYTNKNFHNKLIVRIGGIPMFTQWVEFDRCVVLELCKPSSEVLTSNRDGLVYKYREVVDNFVINLSVNKRKALKSYSPVYQQFVSKKFNVKEVIGTKGQMLVNRTPVIVHPDDRKAQQANTPQVGDWHALDAVAVADGRATIDELLAKSTWSNEDYSAAAELVETGPPPSQIAEDFLVKNETELKIPDYYLPDSGTFCDYAQKLVKYWGRLMLELHKLFEIEDEFSIGFCFSDEAEAQFEQSREYGKLYLLNPAVVVSQQYSLSKSWKKRFKLTERDRLLSIAAHEFVHGIGYDLHNESFACKYTEVFAKVLKERKRFNWAFN